MSLLADHWSFDPFVLVVAALVAANEVGLARLRARSVPSRTRRRRLHSLSFYAGLGVLLVAVDSPVDYWASSYFYVHMIEHLLIAFYAPMLIVFGAPWVPLMHALPVSARRSLGRLVMLGPWSRGLRAVGRFVVSPWFAVLSFNAAMVLWHVPVLFNFSETNQLVHVFLMHAHLLCDRRPVLAPDHPVAPVPHQGVAGVPGVRDHRHERGDVRPRDVAERLHVLELVRRVRPRAGSDALAVRRPAARSGHPVGLRGLLGRPRARRGL